jgi:TolA-binding protein
MATRSKDGIGKDPEEVEAALPSDDAVLEHLESQAEATADPASEPEPPSREELWQVIQDQNEQMEQMAQRIDQLEQQVEDVEFEATTVEEVADQLESGKIGGEAGADFIQQFIEVPSHGSKIDARTTQLFLTIIRENRVGTPVTSSDVVNWFPALQDSANPSVQSKRMMERLVEHREDGFYLGEIELKKHRGKNAIWLAE